MDYSPQLSVWTKLLGKIHQRRKPEKDVENVLDHDGNVAVTCGDDGEKKYDPSQAKQIEDQASGHSTHGWAGNNNKKNGNDDIDHGIMADNEQIPPDNLHKKDRKRPFDLGDVAGRGHKTARSRRH